MSVGFEMNDACPPEMTVFRQGTGVRDVPAGISSGPFWYEILLSSRTDGENTVMRGVAGPGVITHWHSHPRGQILIVLDGVGQAQRDGGPVRDIHAGDCVWFAPGERHWHGAAPTATFSYISIQGVREGTAVDWMEPVDRLEGAQ